MRVASVALLMAFGAALPATANPESRDPARVPPGAYALDKRHASLIAKIPHMGGFSRFTMRFNKLDGGFTYDPANWKATQVKIVVDAASVDTGDMGFSRQVAGYFEPAKYPTMTFVSTGIVGDDGKGVLNGELTFHGVTRPVSLDVAFNGVGPGLLGGGVRVGFSGVGHIKRSDFGVNAVRMFAGDDVDLMFEVEFVKQ